MANLCGIYASFLAAFDDLIFESDMCIRHKKVFAHEHILYPPSQLPSHLPSISHRSMSRNQTQDIVEGGVHPMCEFCRECYFGDDELFAHMRERHEECFICKRDEIRDQ